LPLEGGGDLSGVSSADDEWGRLSAGFDEVREGCPTAEVDQGFGLAQTRARACGEDDDSRRQAHSQVPM
jgi:hypothetical protein